MMNRFIKGVLTLIQEAITQIIGSSSKEVTLTPYAENQMYDWGLSLNTVKDVYYHGKTKPNDKYVLFKQYAGYRVYIKYQYDKKTGKPTILSVNKWSPKK